MNYLLRLFGFKLIRRSMGRWYVEDGQIKRRTVYLNGWRLVRLGVPDDASALELLLGRTVRANGRI
jgi:hypothetical protein